uniref:Uncharacterized protein n=1 Tax=Panagrolaimus sp. JU765 TaxID=591449 RepID=A0AC34RR15_9BILA
MRLSSDFNESDPKCEWQAFQAFAYDTTYDFVGMFSDIIDKDNIFAVSTIKNDLEPCFDDNRQLNYLITETKSSWYGLDLVYNKNFGQNSWFHFFASVATKKLDWNSNCQFQQLNANQWVFSSYDLTKGYPHNTHCRTVVNKSEGYQYKLWFEQYHIEPHFDNVTINTVDEDPIILKNFVYIVPYTDFAIQFDSDGSINQAGFILHIEKYGQFNSFINRIAL